MNMKNNPNIFRATSSSNAVRFLSIFCIVVVVGAALLLLSVSSVRQSIVAWFGVDNDTLNKKKVAVTNDEEAGLADTAVVNNNNHVKALTLDDHVWGNVSAPVQVITYLDFECPFCFQFQTTINRLRSEFGNDIVIGVRHFPLTNHSQAMPAAIAAECAGKQDKFFEMYRELFNLQTSGGLNEASIAKVASTIGLDQDAYNACLTNKEPEAKISAQKDEARALGVGGTPATFVNGDYYAGAVPFDDFIHPDGTQAKGLGTLVREKLAR